MGECDDAETSKSAVVSGTILLKVNFRDFQLINFSHKKNQRFEFRDNPPIFPITDSRCHVIKFVKSATAREQQSVEGAE